MPYYQIGDWTKIDKSESDWHGRIARIVEMNNLGYQKGMYYIAEIIPERGKVHFVIPPENYP
jgi:hypothetical protein